MFLKQRLILGKNLLIKCTLLSQIVSLLNHHSTQILRTLTQSLRLFAQIHRLLASILKISTQTQRLPALTLRLLT